MIERASEFEITAAPPASGGRENMTAGAILREAREVLGLHVDVVAATLKVPPQRLVALESDDLKSLPDPVFTRALAASVCRILQIDSAPVLAKLPGAQPPELAQADQAIGKTLRSASPRLGGAPGPRLSRPLVIVVLLLLAGAAALFWLPQSLFDRARDSMARIVHRDAASEQAPGAPDLEPQPAAKDVAPIAPPAPAAPAASTAPVPAPLPPADPAPSAAVPATAAPAAPASSDLLVFVARDDTWISVTEPGGKQLLQRIVKAGEAVSLNGTPPLSVVIGRASGVDVRVRGEPFDLAPITHSGGVARFEIKP
jgi:cytoskeleton protein RodZ